MDDVLARRLWRARVFGLDVRGRFPAPGLDAFAGEPLATRRVDLELLDDGTVDGWPDSGVERVVRQLRPPMTLDRHEAAGYLLRADRFGSYLLSHDGARVRCAPIVDAGWRWQRFLTGQVLPLAGILRGLEVLHASAVAVDGRAFAFIGASGAGKTSIAINLALRGAPLLADDVLAVEPGVGSSPVLAHAGAGVINVRHAEASRLGENALARLGRPLGSDAKGIRLASAPSGATLPLRGLYLLVRSEAGAEPVIDDLPTVHPRELLGATFNFAIRTSVRMTQQLDVHARLAATASICRIAIPPSCDAGDVADTIEAHAGSLGP